MSLVLGLDIGGTHSRARLARDGETLAEAKAGSASLTAAGAAAATAALEKLLSDLNLSAYGPLDAVCAGSAGSGSPEAVDFLRSHLVPLTSSGTVIVVNDARLVLSAAGLEDGIAVISGTGSMCIGVLNGREARAGGLGYLLGDEGSGYWVVREAIRTLAGRSDCEVPLGPLGDDLLAAAGAADLVDLIQRFYDHHNPDGWAAHAGVVLSSADSAAEQILQAAAHALASFVLTVAETLSAPLDMRVVLAGGLATGHQPLVDAVRSVVQETRPRATVRALTGPPVAGAIRLAEQAAARDRAV